MLYQPIAKSQVSRRDVHSCGCTYHSSWRCPLTRFASQLEWLASLNPLEHGISSSNRFFRKT
jgi:hypothetical protein